MSRPWIWPPPGVRDYNGLEGVSRADLAAHWLWRDPEYRKLASAASRRTVNGVLTDAAPPWCVDRWGCLHILDLSERGGLPLLWSAAVQSSVLRVTASRAVRCNSAAFDLRRWADHAALVVESSGCEHLVLHGHGRMLRLDVAAGSLLSGPVQLAYEVDCSAASDLAIATLNRLRVPCRTGDFASLPVDPSPAKREIETLRVHDALAEGASIREIGIILFGADRIRREWNAPGEALKSYCRRLIARARFMASGGYRSLLQ